MVKQVRVIIIYDYWNAYGRVSFVNIINVKQFSELCIFRVLYRTRESPVVLGKSDQPFKLRIDRRAVTDGRRFVDDVT